MNDEEKKDPLEQVEEWMLFKLTVPNEVSLQVKWTSTHEFKVDEDKGHVSPYQRFFLCKTTLEAREIQKQISQLRVTSQKEDDLEWDAWLRILERNLELQGQLIHHGLSELHMRYLKWSVYANEIRDFVIGCKQKFVIRKKLLADLRLMLRSAFPFQLSLGFAIFSEVTKTCAMCIDYYGSSPDHYVETCPKCFLSISESATRRLWFSSYSIQEREKMQSSAMRFVTQWKKEVRECEWKYENDDLVDTLCEEWKRDQDWTDAIHEKGIPWVCQRKRPIGTSLEYLHVLYNVKEKTLELEYPRNLLEIEMDTYVPIDLCVDGMVLTQGRLLWKGLPQKETGK
jgi:hypothetical protein